MTETKQQSPSATAVAKTIDQQLDEFTAYIEQLPSDTPEQVQGRILRSLLSASTPDELIAAGSSLSGEKLCGVPGYNLPGAKTCLVTTPLGAPACGCESGPSV